MSLNFDTSCCYKIRERTKAQWVTIQPEGPLRRWEPLTGANENRQIFFIYPVKEDGKDSKETKYRLQSLSNHEYVGLGTDAFVRWAKADNGTQLFSIHQAGKRYSLFGDNEAFENLSKSMHDSLKKEGLSDELLIAAGVNHKQLYKLRVGDDKLLTVYDQHHGYIKPHFDNNAPEQHFELVATNVKKPADTKYGKNLPACIDDSEVKDFPKLDSTEPPSKRSTKPVVLSVTTVPSALVEDERFSDKIYQFEASPYYFIVQERFWDASDPQDKIELTGRETTEQEIIDYRGFSQKDMESIEKVVGFSINASATASASVGTVAPKDTGGPEASAGVEASLSYTYSEQEKKRSESTKVFDEWRQTKTKLSFAPQGKQVLVLRWKLVDQFHLRDSEGNTIKTWTNIADNRIDSFPKS